MDDYAGAYLARKNDISALPKDPKHTIAIFHLGGIALECRLKAHLIHYHRINQWDDLSRRNKDAMFNQAISNPGHSLLSALRRMPDFYQRARLDKQLLEHLQHLIYPLGPTNIDYISLRYIPQTNQSQADWQKSFDYVCGWLEKNGKNLL